MIDIILSGAIFCIVIILFFRLNEEKKVRGEFEELKIQVQHLQDTLDHYGIRMSNKIPDGNKYYKRGYTK